MSYDAKVVVAGFGSQDRRDDGVGPLVAALAVAASPSAHDIGPLTDPLDLLGSWNDADLVIVIDAVRSGASPGTVQILEMNLDALNDPSEGEVEPEPIITSTHGIGLAGVVRLAQVVGHAPRRLVVVGIEGERFDFGEGLSPLVDVAVPEAVRCVIDLIEEVQRCA